MTKAASESLLQRAIRRVGAEAFMRQVERMSPEQRLELRYNWRLIGRPEQHAPASAWRTWLFMAGRGGGKTRSASEWVRSLVESGQAGRIALVGETAADARDVMVEGPSGLVTTARPGFRPHYEPSKRRLTWPNGAIATTYSADDPEQLRGPEHDAAWCDELAKWRHAKASWSNMQFGLRVNGPDGSPPRVVVTTTPRPTPEVIKLARGKRQPDGTWKQRRNTVVTHCSTYANAANLAPSYLEELLEEYEGTMLGRQELDAEILDEIEGALWKLADIDADRVSTAPDLRRIVVAVDPATTEGGNETGIIGAGIARGSDGNDHGYVLADKSRRGKPIEWARAAVDLYRALEADCIVAESNQGGDMVKHTLHSVDPAVPVRMVHASRGKRTRAEPISALCEQHRIHHVGAFPKLEDQQTTWLPGDDSPDRLDAYVWAMTELMVGARPPSRAPAIPWRLDLR